MDKHAKKTSHSPIENTLRVIGSKWTILIVQELSGGVRRFGEIEKSLKGISPRTLSMRLSSLEKHGVVERKVYAEVPPRVEYKLSSFGRGLEPVIKSMRNWGSVYAKKYHS